MVSGKYLILGGIGVIGSGVAGTSIYLYGFREDTLETRVKNHFKDKKHMLILNSSSQVEGIKFKEFYSHSKDKKPEGIDKDGISKGCEEKLPSRDGSSFELVKKGCVINSRSMKDEALDSNRKLIPVSASSAETEWQNAGTTYNSKKADLDIKDSEFLRTSNNQATTGGPALKKGCEAKSSKFMYEYLGEDKGYEKYYAWCTRE